MSINVGQVEAVLAARDTMSPALVSAAEKVRELRTQLETLGPVTKENSNQISNLYNQLALAENAFKLAGEAQERQAVIAEKAAQRAELLAKMQEVQTTTAQGATAASGAVTAALNAQVTSTEAAIKAQSALSAAMAAAGGTSQAKAIENIANRLTELYASGPNIPLTSRGIPTVDVGKVAKATNEYQEEVKKLETSLRAMTDASTVAEVRTKALAAAKIAGAQASVTAKAATEDEEKANTRSTAGMAQMEAMTSRLITRMLVLYALHAAFAGVKTIFTDAEELVKLSESTDLSLGKLQQLRIESGTLGIEFSKTVTALEHFDKALADMNISTLDALAPLHLNFEKLFALSSDQRLDTVIKAIAALPNQLDRSKAEFALFGTDAIDPMIKKWAELGEAASKAIEPDATVRALAATATMYRSWWENDIKPVMEAIIIKGQDMVAAMAGRYMRDNSTEGWFDVLKGVVFNPVVTVPKIALAGARAAATHFFGDNGLVSDGGGGWYDLDIKQVPPRPDPNVPLHGQAFFDETQRQLKAEPITADQRAKLDVWREEGVLTEAYAAKIDVTSAQLRNYRKEVEDATKAHKALNKELDEYTKQQDEINGLWMRWATLHGEMAERDLLPVQRDELSRQRELASAQGDFNEGRIRDQSQLREKKDAINAYWDDKERQDREKQAESDKAIYERNADDINKVREQAAATENEINLRGLDLQLATLDKQQLAEKANWNKKIDGELKNSDDILALENQRQQGLAAIDDKFNAERARRAAKWEEDKWAEIEQVEQQAQAVEVGFMGNTMQAQLANNAAQLSAVETRLAKQGKLDADYDAALQRLYSDRAQAIVLSFDPLWKAWQDLNGDMRQEWAATWDAAFEKTGNFTQALTAPFTDLVKGFEHMLSGMISDWEYMLLSPMLSTFRNMIGGMFGVSGTGSPFSAIGPGGGFSTTATNSGVGYVIGPNGSLIPINVGAIGGRSTSAGLTGNWDEATGQFIPDPTFKGYEPMPGFGAMAGAGVLTGVGAAMGGGSVGHQLGQEAMAAAGVGVGVAMTTAAGITGGIIAGAVTFGIGAAVIGGIALIKHMMASEQRDIARDAGTEFGQTWSDSLIKTIKDRADKDGPTGVPIGEQAAEILSLPDIMKEHPVDMTNLDMYERKVHDIFSMVETGRFTTQQAGKELDDVFPQLAAASTDAYGRIDSQLRSIIQLNDIWGTQSKAIADWEKQQASAATSGTAATIHALATGGRIDAGTAEGLGQSVLAAWAQEVAMGKTRIEAIRDQSAAITELQQIYRRLHIDVTDTAMGELFLENTVISRNQALIAGLEGVSQAMVAFDNLGTETADMFKGQEKAGVDMWDRIRKATIAAGGTETDALDLMQEFLHNALIESERLGVPLDANIQRLITMSKEAGKWQDDFKPKGSLMDSMQALIDKVQDLIDVLQGKTPSHRGGAGSGKGGTVGGDPGDGGGGPPASAPFVTRAAAASLSSSGGSIVHVHVDARGSFQLYEEFGAKQLADVVGEHIVTNVFQNQKSLYTKSRAAHGLPS